MSIYGGVKRVENNLFQFDHRYHNRAEMEAECATDGIYAGRYVLVEYGEQYKYDTASKTYVQTEEYSSNANADKNAYNMNYDSTVWQKVYVNMDGKVSDKYVMVAELNAVIPKLTTKAIDTVSYSSTDNNKEMFVQMPNQTALSKVKTTETQNKATFDKIGLDSQYNLNMPNTIELDVSSDIDYNKDGFDMYVHSAQRNEDNYVAWAPVLKSPEVKNGVLTKGSASKKVLSMHLTKLGDTLSALYDVLYGVPEIDEKTGKAVRPYFSALGVTLDGAGKATGINEIDDIIANNSMGLAGALHSLAATKDTPLSDSVTFYLATDWAGTKDNSALIKNKPLAVVSQAEANGALSADTGYYTIRYKDDKGAFTWNLQRK